MSFKQVDYCRILDEEWNPNEGPQAYFREVVTTRFLLVVFDRKGDSKTRTFKGVVPFTLPADAELEANKFWNSIREHVRKSDYDGLYALRSRKYFHLRPKAQNAVDTVLTPSGVRAKKYAYWINKTVIYDVLKDHGLV
jgi:hypothetical protein